MIKSLEKAEKRNFKLFVKRNSANQDLKIIQLFDILDKLDEYDESQVLKLGKSLKKAQLSNLKAHLHKQIMASLRIIKDSQDIEYILHDHIENARLLYGKGLIHQSLKVLSKCKELAKTYHQGSFLLQILLFEKKIESLHITRSIKNRAQELAHEIECHHEKLSLIGKISNLSLLLYGKYIENGHARSEAEIESIQTFFQAGLPAGIQQAEGFYERMYLYQAYVWFAYILQDFVLYFRYARKWVDLFVDHPHMRPVETNFYLKGVHHLLQAHYLTGRARKYEETIQEFKGFVESPGYLLHRNTRIQANIYLALAQLNHFLMTGKVDEGLALVPEVEEFLEQYKLQMDPHHRLIFYYKIASLYFVAEDYSKTVDYLTRIMNWTWNLRDDIQCYTRLLHLITHYELGNYDILDSLAKSAYRYMAKMDNLSVVEEEIFRFIRQSFNLYHEELPHAFIGLLNKLKEFENNPLERRAFNYLDFISWLEAKIEKRAVKDILREKYGLPE